MTNFGQASGSHRLDPRRSIAPAMRSGPGRVSPTGGRTVARIGVVGLALALLPVVGAAALAGAATPANAFKLSGSGSGTITPGSTASCLAGTEAGGVIELDDL